MEWLKRSAESGFFDDPNHRDQGRRDADLVSLRSYPEFPKLIGDKPR